MTVCALAVSTAVLSSHPWAPASNNPVAGPAADRTAVSPGPAASSPSADDGTPTAVDEARVDAGLEEVRARAERVDPAHFAGIGIRDAATGTLVVWLRNGSQAAAGLREAAAKHGLAVEFRSSLLARPEQDAAKLRFRALQAELAELGYTIDAIGWDLEADHMRLVLDARQGAAPVSEADHVLRGVGVPFAIEMGGVETVSGITRVESSP